MEKEDEIDIKEIKNYSINDLTLGLDKQMKIDKKNIIEHECLLE